MNYFLNISFVNIKKVILIGLIFEDLSHKRISSFLRKCSKSFLFWAEDISWLRVYLLCISYLLSTRLRVRNIAGNKTLKKKKCCHQSTLITWEKDTACSVSSTTIGWGLPLPTPCGDYDIFTTVVSGVCQHSAWRKQVLIHLCWTNVQTWRNSGQLLKGRGFQGKGNSMPSSSRLGTRLACRKGCTPSLATKV